MRSRKKILTHSLVLMSYETESTYVTMALRIPAMTPKTHRLEPCVESRRKTVLAEVTA